LLHVCDGEERDAARAHVKYLLLHPEEIDDEIIEAVKAAAVEWKVLELALAATKAGAKTIETEPEAPTPEPAPDRRKTSEQLFDKLEQTLKKRGRPPGSKNKCKKCGGTGRIVGKTGTPFDCECVKGAA
jgi:hypothetical protein